MSPQTPRPRTGDRVVDEDASTSGGLRRGLVVVMVRAWNLPRAALVRGENGGGVKAQYGVQENVWVKGPMMAKAKIEINGVGVGGDLYVQGTMTDDASIFIDAGGGVRNINVQAEMSGNAKITVVGEVSGSITVASMSGNAKIEAGSCAKPTTKTGTITGSAAITGTGC